MKLLCVHPGASFSTHDVHVGLTSALRRRGHQLYEYALDGRISAAGGYLMYAWHKAGGKTSGHRKPTPSDIVYKASSELFQRAARIRPDWIIVTSSMYLHPDVLVEMHALSCRQCGSHPIPVALLFTESPYDDESQTKLVPYVRVAWTNERTSAVGGVRYLPHAINADIHMDGPHADDADVPAHDVVFVGTGFQERIDTLAAVDWTGIDLGLYGVWDLLGSRHHLRKYIRGGVQDNAKAAALYRRAKIGLNLYRTSTTYGKDTRRVTHAESLNPRAYELAATGCFTISDARPEVIEKFGDLVPTFTSPAELAALVRRWLADDSGRARIRAALPGCVSGDTWDARAADVERDLQRVGSSSREAVSA